LKLDPKLIALDLARWPRSLDQMLMHGLRVLTAFLKPVPDRSFIQTKGEDDRLDGAAVREQFDHQRDQVSALPQAVKESPSGGAEAHLALTANVTTVFLGMDADVAFSNLSSGGTVEVGTKCGFWGQWRFFFLTRHKEKRRLTSDFFQRAIRPRLNVELPKNGIFIFLSHIFLSGGRNDDQARGGNPDSFPNVHWAISGPMTNERGTVTNDKCSYFAIY
jgi:hypothetical protein